MAMFNLDPQDRRWLRRWLGTQLICTSVAMAILLWLRIGSGVPIKPLPSPLPIATAQAASNQSLAVTSQPAAAMGNGVSVAPQGWRRTVNGWEHVSQWQLPPPRPLQEWISVQQQREPDWAEATLQRLRDLPPVNYALFQLTAIVGIVWLAEVGKKRRGVLADRP
jgi:hypothetical protein